MPIVTNTVNAAHPIVVYSHSEYEKIVWSYSTRYYPAFRNNTTQIDLGGTLGGDELSEASGAPDGVEASIGTLSRIVKDLGRNPIERNSKYTEFYPLEL